MQYGDAHPLRINVMIRQYEYQACLHPSLPYTAVSSGLWNVSTNANHPLEAIDWDQAKTRLRAPFFNPASFIGTGPMVVTLNQHDYTLWGAFIFRDPEPQLLLGVDFCTHSGLLIDFSSYSYQIQNNGYEFGPLLPVILRNHRNDPLLPPLMSPPEPTTPTTQSGTPFETPINGTVATLLQLSRQGRLDIIIFPQFKTNP